MENCQFIVKDFTKIATKVMWQEQNNSQAFALARETLHPRLHLKLILLNE